MIDSHSLVFFPSQAGVDQSENQEAPEDRGVHEPLAQMVLVEVADEPEIQKKGFQKIMQDEDGSNTKRSFSATAALGVAMLFVFGLSGFFVMSHLSTSNPDSTEPSASALSHVREELKLPVQSPPFQLPPPPSLSPPSSTLLPAPPSVPCMGEIRLSIQQKTSVQNEAAGVGAWGGTCTCPDGDSYEVGDNNDDCASLACVGGSMGPCKQFKNKVCRHFVVAFVRSRGPAGGCIGREGGVGLGWGGGAGSGGVRSVREGRVNW